MIRLAPFELSSQLPSQHIRTDLAQVGGELTEELFTATALLNHLNKARFQLLNRGHVVGEDAHFARLGGYIDLDARKGCVSMAWFS